MDQWLEAFNDFVGDPSSSPKTHMVACKHLYSSSWVSDAPFWYSWAPELMCTNTQIPT